MKIRCTLTWPDGARLTADVAGDYPTHAVPVAYAGSVDRIDPIRECGPVYLEAVLGPAATAAGATMTVERNGEYAAGE